MAPVSKLRKNVAPWGFETPWRSVREFAILVFEPVRARVARCPEGQVIRAG